MHFAQSSVYAAVGMNHIIQVLDDTAGNKMEVADLGLHGNGNVADQATKRFKNTDTGTFLNPDIK